jgi:hypothetical protein
MSVQLVKIPTAILLILDSLATSVQLAKIPTAILLIIGNQVDLLTNRIKV